MASLGSTLLLNIMISICTNVMASAITNYMDCKLSPEVCTTSFCKLSKPRGSIAYLSASCYMEKPMDNVLMYSEVLQKVSKKYRGTGLRIEQNFCKFSALQSGNPLLSSMMSLTAKNIRNIKCPMKGNVTVNKIPFTLHMAQGLLAKGDYLLAIKLYTEKVRVLDANLSFTISPVKYGL